MNRLLLIVLGAAAVPIFAPTPVRAMPVPLFNQCPPLGQALGCSYLLVFGPNGSSSLLFDQNIMDVDSQEDILVGIQNSSGSYLSLSDCKGSYKAFSGIHLMGGLSDGKSAHFVTKDSSESANEKTEDDDQDEHVTPEPGSLVLLGTGLMLLGGILRRKLVL
jgi:hypothetical protein